MTTQKVVLEVTAKTQGAIKGFKDAKGEVSNLTESFKGLAVASGAAFAAIAGGALLAVKEFAAFDNALRGTKTLLDDDSFADVGKSLEEGFKDLQKGTLDVIAQIPVESDAATKALFDLVSAGVSASKATEALGTAARLAVAGQTSVAVATDGITSALNAYGLEADQAELISAKFFTAQKKGKTTIEELASGFGKVGATANALGVSFDEVLASVSTLTLGGVKTAEAYTSLNAVLAGIAKPTSEAAEEAARLGIDFSAAGLEAKGLTGFLESLTSNQNFNKESAIKLFGSIEALKAIFALTGQGAEQYDKILKDISDDTQAVITLTNAYEEQSGSLENRVKSLQNKMFKLAVTIGEKLEPFFVKLAEVAEEVLIWVQELIEENGELVIKIAAVAAIITGTVAALATFAVGIGAVYTQLIAFKAAMVTVMGFLSTTVVPFIVKTLIPAIGGLLAIIGKLVIFLLANPIGIAITALTAVIYGFYKAWETNFLGIQEITAGVFEAIKFFFNDFKNTATNFTDFWNQLIDGITGAFERGSNKRKQLLEEEAAGEKSIRDLTANIVRNSEDQKTNAVKAGSQKRINIGEMEAEAAERSAKKKTKAEIEEEKRAQKIKEREAQKAAEEREKLRKEEAEKRKKDAEAAIKINQGIEDQKITDQIARIEREKIAEGETQKAVADGLGEIFTLRNQLHEQRVENIKTSGAGELEQLALIRKAEFDLENDRMKFADAALDRSNKLLEEEIKRLDKEEEEKRKRAEKEAEERQKTIDSVFNAFDTAGAGIQAAIDGVTDLFSGGGLARLTESLDRFLGAPIAFADNAENLINKIGELEEGLNSAVARLPGLFDQLAHAFVRTFPKLVNAFVKAVPIIVKGLVKVAPLIVKAIAQALPVVVRAIVNAIPALLEILPELFEALLQGIAGAFDAILDGLPTIILTLFDQLPALFKAIVDIIPDFVESFAENIGPIVEALVEGLLTNAPLIIGALIDSLLLEGGLERIVGALIRAMPRVAIALVVGMLKAVQNLAGGFGASFGQAFLSGIQLHLSGISGAFGRAIFQALQIYLTPLITAFNLFGKFINGFTGAVQSLLSIPQKIKDAINSFNPFGGGGGSGGVIGQVVGGVGSALGFQYGTAAVPMGGKVIPFGGYAQGGRSMITSPIGPPRGVDSVAIRAQVGERIFSVPQNREIIDALRNGGGAKDINLKLVISPSGFAKMVDQALVTSSSTGVGSVQVAVGSED